MSKSYLKQLFIYINKVYDIGKKINTLKDKRLKSEVKISTIAFVTLFGFMLQIRSFNRLEHWLERGKLNKLLPKKTRMPRIDAVRRFLSNFDLDGLKEIHKHTIKTSISYLGTGNA